LRLGYYGESLFVAFQVRFGLTTYAEIAELIGQPEEKDWALEQRDLLDKKIQKHTWDGNWFIWAIGEDGSVYGTKDYKEGQVYLNTQVWSIISGAATADQAEKSMNTVKEKLATPYGVMLCAPPFKETSVEIMSSVVFNEGIKENAGIFNHTQGWAVMAECMLGNGDRSYEYYRSFMPAAYNEKAEIRQIEPYVQGQTTYSTFSPRAGNTRTSWLTGAAPWAYYSATQYILGIRPEFNGLRIDPCIPSSWKGFKVERKFRNKLLKISVINDNNVQKGVSKIVINDETISGDFIPVNKMKDINTVTVIMKNDER
jgi:cellobiose phosphorylase